MFFYEFRKPLIIFLAKIFPDTLQFRILQMATFYLWEILYTVETSVPFSLL